MRYYRYICIFNPIIYDLRLFLDIFFDYLSPSDSSDFYCAAYVKIKFEVVDRLNLILTNLTLYDQHYFAAISDSPTGLNQTIWALAAMLLLIDIPNEIIFY